MIRRTAMVGALLGLGCGRSVESLERPTLVRFWGNSLCLSAQALDPQDEVWVAPGACESGALRLHSKGTATAAAATTLRAHFTQLDVVECRTSDGGVGDGQFHARYRRQGASADQTWEACETVGIAPWAALDAAFDAL